MARVVVIGLGPGNPDRITAEALAAIDRIAHRYLRTGRHPSAYLVSDATSFDHVYESAATFDAVYATIAEELVEAATAHGTVLYAVPGSPLVLEKTVALLRSRAGVEVDVLPAVGFLDDAWRALAIDPVDTAVKIVDGHTFAESAAGYTGPLLIAHTHANWVLSNIKLTIDDVDPDTEVVMLHHLGLDDERVVHTTWSEMDKTIEADHLTSVFVPMLGTPVAHEMVRFHALARTLREQCPWDMEQTHASLVRYLVEETYEVIDAIDKLDANDPSTDDDFIEELGDLLYQVGFHAAIAEEQGRFSIADVARVVHDKLVARHPHVFGDVSAETAGEVERNWEMLKQAEKPERTGLFDGVVQGAPSLSFASKMQQRAARGGFDWPDVNGPLDKVGEELAEVTQSLGQGDPEATAVEIGDLLFAVVNVARHLDVDPESALRSAVHKFRNRVEAVEALAAARGLVMKDMSPRQLDELWEVVKNDPTH